MKIAKPAFPPEFRDLAIKRVKAGESVGRVAKELGLVEQTLRNWVKAAAKGTSNGAGNRMVTPEEMELSRLRAENARLKRELEIVKKLRRTSRGMPCEVRLDRLASAGVRVVGTVRGIVRPTVAERIASPTPAQHPLTVYAQLLAQLQVAAERTP